jgi:hypothetical protein
MKSKTAVHHYYCQTVAFSLSKKFILPKLPSVIIRFVQNGYQILPSSRALRPRIEEVYFLAFRAKKYEWVGDKPDP